jgi:hypothetical protein
MKTNKRTPTRLYQHKTDGGAEYLMDAFIECPNGHREGVFEGATIIIRLDGEPELLACAGIDPAAVPELLAACKALLSLVEVYGPMDSLHFQDGLVSFRAAIALAEGGAR